MTISLTVEISKSEVKKFSGLVKEIYHIALGIPYEKAALPLIAILPTLWNLLMIPLQVKTFIKE